MDRPIDDEHLAWLSEPSRRLLQEELQADAEAVEAEPEEGDEPTTSP